MDSVDRLIAKDDSSTVNNYLNKLEYPDRSAPMVGIKIDARQIAQGMRAGAYDTDMDVEVVETSAEQGVNRDG